MNDKERLIHIAGKVDKLCAQADSEGNGTVNIFAIQNDMNWLISKIEQQQKEIKELKIAGEFFETGYHQFEKENQRYREALKKIMLEQHQYMEGYETETFSIAKNALGMSKNDVINLLEGTE